MMMGSGLLGHSTYHHTSASLVRIVFPRRGNDSRIFYWASSTGDEWRCCPGYADFRVTQETGRIVHNLKEPESGCDTTDFQGSIDIKETKR